MVKKHFPVATRLPSPRMGPELKCHHYKNVLKCNIQMNIHVQENFCDFSLGHRALPARRRPPRSLRTDRSIIPTQREV